MLDATCQDKAVKACTSVNYALTSFVNDSTTGLLRMQEHSLKRIPFMLTQTVLPSYHGVQIC